MTEEYLISRYWWWRRETKERKYDAIFFRTDMKPGAKDLDWKKSVERGALRYELARRHKRDENWPRWDKDPTFAKLLEEEMLFDLDQACYLPEGGLIGFDEGFEYIPRLKWNLRASDRILSKAFLELIHAERARRKLRPPRGPEHRRNRPGSWRWPEILDIVDFSIRKISKAEHEIERAARDTAERFYDHLRLRCPSE